MAPRKQPICIYYPPDHSTIKGDRQILAAYLKRDLDGLAQALRAHPGAWKAHLGKVDSEGYAEDGSIFSHFVIEHGWHDALAVLKDAGDPLDHIDPSTKHTLRGAAVAAGNVKALDWLLKNGPEEPDGAINAMEALALHVNAPKMAARMADMLIQSGYSPWSRNKAGYDCITLFIGSGQIGLAARLAREKGSQGALLDDLLSRVWIETVSRGTIEDQTNLLDAIYDQGRGPVISDILAEIKNNHNRSLGRRLSLERLEPLILHIKEKGLPLGEAKLLREALSDFSSVPKNLLDEHIADLDRQILGTSTLAVSRQARHKRI